MANQPIPVAQAEAMIQDYKDYLADLNIGSQTESVSFNSSALMNWMESVKDYTDEFRIFFGVYGGPERKDRITTIIWPYKDGEPASQPAVLGREAGDGDDPPPPPPPGTTLQPFNEGHLRP